MREGSPAACGGLVPDKHVRVGRHNIVRTYCHRGAITQWRGEGGPPASLYIPEVHEHSQISMNVHRQNAKRRGSKAISTVNNDYSDIHWSWYI
jgi:hypothetical protein